MTQRNANVLLANIPDYDPRLTHTEQEWLGIARAHLVLIDENRAHGRSNNCAYCIFEVRNAYVQFLAPFDNESLYCEAASAKCVPSLAPIVTPEKEKLLYDLGFQPIGNAPNYSRNVELASPSDFNYGAHLALHTLKHVYDIRDFSLATFKLNIPDHPQEVFQQ